MSPYRRKPFAAERQRVRRPRFTTLGLSVAFIWAMSVARLVSAYETDEHVGVEPVLAALLTAAPPAALVYRALRR